MGATDRNEKRLYRNTVFFHLAPEAGIEPATNRLTGDCSTAELLRNMFFYKLPSSVTFELFLSQECLTSGLMILGKDNNPLSIES